MTDYDDEIMAFLPFNPTIADKEGNRITIKSKFSLVVETTPEDYTTKPVKVGDHEFDVIPFSQETGFSDEQTAQLEALCAAHPKAVLLMGRVPAAHCPPSINNRVYMIPFGKKYNIREGNHVQYVTALQDYPQWV